MHLPRLPASCVLSQPAAFELFGGAGFVVALLWAIAPREAAAAAAEAEAGAAARYQAALQCDVRAAEVECELVVESDEEAKAGLADVPWGPIARSRPVWALAASHMSNNFFMYFGLSWLPTRSARGWSTTSRALRRVTCSPSRRPSPSPSSGCALSRRRAPGGRRGTC